MNSCGVDCHQSEALEKGEMVSVFWFAFYLFGKYGLMMQDAKRLASFAIVSVSL